MELRNCQKIAIEHALEWVKKKLPKIMYVAPTGSGKSLCEITLLEKLPDWILITPRIEIIRGMLAKLNVDTTEMSDEVVVGVSWKLYRIITPIRLRNLLARGELTFQPAGVIIDEVHHAEAETYQELDIMLDRVPCIGFTATPYRGTIKGTIALRQKWGKPVWILTYPQAVDLGYIALPKCSVQPLVDDDIIEVQNGEFQVTKLTEATCSSAEALAGICRVFYTDTWDRPTIFAFPSKECCRTIAAVFNFLGLPVECITEETRNRDEIIRRCLDKKIAIFQINVISEGVDAPFRRLIDCRATLSPVVFVQQLGRIMRPSVDPPEYICTNRNLERFCYLLDGILPSETIISVQTAFDGGISRRAAGRVLGLENLGRFKAAELPLRNGTTGIMYSLQAVEGTQVVEYAVLINPVSPEPIIACRKIGKNADGTRDYKASKWQAAELPDDLVGYASAPTSQITPPMKAWWDKCAEMKGLDPFAKVNRKNFAALPVLSDLRRVI